MSRYRGGGPGHGGGSRHRAGGGAAAGQAGGHRDLRGQEHREQQVRRSISWAWTFLQFYFLRSTAAQIRGEGGNAWSYQCDVSDRKAVGEMADRVRREVGDVNILVNNARIMITKQFMQQTDAEIMSTINVRQENYSWQISEMFTSLLTG